MKEIMSSNKKIYIFYSIGFLLIGAIVWYPFFFLKMSLVNIYDPILQLLPVKIYIHNWIKEVIYNFLNGSLSIPMFDFRIGLGEDIIQTLNWCGFGDPLVVISSIFPIRYTELVYSLVYILQVYISGFTFLVFCLYKKHTSKYILLGAYIYSFSGFSVNLGLQWNVFLNFSMLLPLLLLGVEKFVKEKKKGVFIATVFYAGICSYYVLFGLTIIGVLYAIIFLWNYSTTTKQKILSFINFIKLYLVSIFLSAPILIPAIIGVLYCSRTEKNIYGNLIIYNFKEILNRFVCLVGPYFNSSLSIVSYSIILLILFIITQYKNEKKFWCFSIIIIVTCFFSPFGSYMLTGFSYPNDRISYIFNFIIAYTSVYMLEEFFVKKNIYLRKLFFATIMFVFLIIIVAKNNSSILYSTLFILLFLIVCILYQYMQKDTTENFSKHKIYFPMVSLLGLMIINILVSSVYSWNSQLGNMISWIYTDKTYNEKINSYDINVMATLNGKYNVNDRVDVFPRKIEYNKGMIFGVSTLTEYFSVMNRAFSEYSSQLENAGKHWNHAIEGLDNRTYLNALASVRYLCINKNDLQSIPYGYEYVGGNENTNIYENLLQLPLGFTYTSYFKNLDSHPVNLQQMMLQSVYVEDDLKLVGESKNFDRNAKEIPFTLMSENNYYRDGKLHIENTEEPIRLEYSANSNSELYLSVENINSLYIDEFAFNTSTSQKYGSVYILGEKNYYSYGQKNFLLNLGYYKEAATDICELKVSALGDYDVSDIKLYELPMDDYKKEIDNLKYESLQDMEYKNNYIKGTIDTSSNKFLMFSIPYSKGWKVYVDGKEEKIIQSNILYFGVELEAGQHVIELRYCTPGIKLGLSLFGLGIISIVFMFWNNKKRGEKVNKKLRSML